MYELGQVPTEISAGGKGPPHCPSTAWVVRDVQQACTNSIPPRCTYSWKCVKAAIVENGRNPIFQPIAPEIIDETDAMIEQEDVFSSLAGKIGISKNLLLMGIGLGALFFLTRK